MVYLKYLFCFIFLFEASASPEFHFGQHRVKTFLRNDYHAHRQNWSIAQGKDGNIYFANANGLLAYNGSRWHLYNFPQIIRSLFVDQHGRLFSGSQGEFGFWENDPSGQMVYKSLKHLIKNRNIDLESIWHITEVPDGILFQSFAYAFLFKDHRIEELKLPGNIHFIESGFGKTIVPGIKTGLFGYKNGMFTEIPQSKAAFSSQAIVAILLPDPNTELIVTTRGIFEKKPKGYISFNKKLNQTLEKFEVNKAILTKSGQMVFGTVLNGLVITDPSGNILETINKDNGLANNTVLSLRLDKDQNLWVGTDNGISMVELNADLKYYQDLSGGLGTVYDVAYFNNLLYVGTNHGVFYKAPENASPFKLVPGTLGQVWSLTVLKNDLVVGHNSGTFLVKNQKAQKISEANGGWQMIQLSQDPNFAIMANYTGLLLFKFDGGWKEVHRYREYTGNAKQIVQDAQGNIWIKTGYNEIRKLNLSRSFRSITEHKIFKFNVPLDSPVSLYSAHGKVSILNGKIEATYDPQLKNFYVSKAERVPKRQFKWGADSLISMFSENLIVLGNNTYGFEENSFVEEYENIKRVGNYAVVCLEDGLAYFKYKPEKNEKKKTKLRVASYELDDRFYHLNPLKSKLSLPYGASFKLFFESGDLSKSAQFSTKLGNGSWVQSQDFRQFSNLEAGTYVLSLKSNVNPTPVLYEFEILPPWYLNIWAKGLYLSLVLGLIYFLYVLHLKRLDHHKRAIEEAYQKEVEKQQQEMIKFRNEQLEKDLIRKSEELANSTMALIKKNEILGKIKEVATQKDQIGIIDKHISAEQDWRVFETNFNQVHESFLKILGQGHPDLSHGDLKLAAYLRMNLSTKEISNLLNITIRSVELKRYRLRKKMKLPTDIDLNEYMMKV